MSKMETLRDDFGSGTINTVKWNDNTGAISIDAGRAKLLRTPSGLVTLASTNTCDISESYLAAKVTLDSGMLTEQGHILAMNAIIGDGSQNRAGITFSTDSVGAYTSFSSIENGTFYAGPKIAYDAVNHSWWRVRESAGTLYWDTSADGIKWTNRHSRTHSLSTTQLSPWFQTAFGFGGTSSKPVYIDNVNVFPNPAAFLPFFI